MDDRLLASEDEVSGASASSDNPKPKRPKHDTSALEERLLAAAPEHLQLLAAIQKYIFMSGTPNNAFFQSFRTKIDTAARIKTEAEPKVENVKAPFNPYSF